MLASHTGPTSEGSGRGLPNVEPPSSERATPRQLHVTLLVLYPRWYASFRMLTSTPPLGVSAKHGSTCSCSMAGFRGSLAFLASLNVAPPSSEYQTTEKVHSVARSEKYPVWVEPVACGELDTCTWTHANDGHADEERTQVVERCRSVPRMSPPGRWT
jgi:hypothetical protein